MRWICAVCGRESTGYGLLGVAVHKAMPGACERWKTVHYPCFEQAQLTYGLDFRDIEARGWQWWVRHIGEKSWAQYTDYDYALGEVG